MKKTTKTIGMLLMLALTTASAQQKTQVTDFRLAGPFKVAQPLSVDTVDVNGKAFDEASWLQTLPLTATPTQTYNGTLVPSLGDAKSVGVLTFYINNSDYVKGTLSVKGPKHSKVYVDGKETTSLDLWPEHHTIAIRYVAEPGDTARLSVGIDASRPVVTTTSEQHPYTLHDLTDGRRVRGISLSADGRYASLNYQTTERDGTSRWDYELVDLKSGQVVARPQGSLRWMPTSCACLTDVKENGQRKLYKLDPLSGQRTLLASGLPEGSFTMSPTEDYLIITQEEEGPKEDAGVFQVLEMDDRQPGFRKRSYLSKFDLKSGLCQRITFGNRSSYLTDISNDGRKLLVMISRTRLEKRPTTVVDALIVDAQTLQADTILQGAEFVNTLGFSPDATQLLVEGTPEAFNRIGCQLPADVTPSMTENELFVYDLASRQVTPLTKDFDPSLTGSFEWSAADGLIYFAAEDRDYVRLYQLNPQTGNIVQLPIQGDYAYRFDKARLAPQLAYLSYATLAPASAYAANLKSLNTKRQTMSQLTLFDGKTALGAAQVGTCQDWNFTNSRGDTVYGRLYLPKDFDATKKYPMIVYYYGGCSPVSRYFESPYAPQMWNSLGYVAYIVEPSGATGFGQEWASRHVNTAGRGPADDIIEGVKKICQEHPFINKEKIGCMGASYGGFMTQYLQTQTDIFAAAVSHAGIANHTSYWGEGYWGYNYSEVSMANSYPWSHRQLYVDQSPLFNADKIHTPLLLLHGNADTNVPLVESLQMFTALKLLGREVALVEVEGQNHHILDYAKRERWVATQMAWFQRWLKDDPSWWDALYPKKNL